MTNSPTRTQGRLVVVGTGQVLAAVARLASDPWNLLRGLIGRGDFPAGHALGLAPGNQIHTFGVPFALDLIYCDRQGCVLSVAQNFPTNRIGPRVAGGRTVWEMRTGTLPTSGTALVPGDMIRLMEP